jgi:uncharacterized membrane protein YkvA (DUF1232 family)
MLERIRAWAKDTELEGLALYIAIRDPRTPWYAQALGAFVVAYALSPIDLIPDFIPVLGYLDDLLILPVGFWLTVRLIPSDVVTEARAAAKAQLAERRPRSFAGAAIVVAVWLSAVALVFVVARRLLPPAH